MKKFCSVAAITASLWLGACSGDSAEQLSDTVQSAVEAFSSGDTEQLFLLQSSTCQSELEQERFERTVEAQRSKYELLLATPIEQLVAGDIEVTITSETTATVGAELLDGQNQLAVAEADNQTLWEMDETGKWNPQFCGGLPISER